MTARITSRRTAGVAALVVAAISLSACTGSETAPAAGSPESGTALSGELTVYAAASLKAAFDDIAAAFTAFTWPTVRFRNPFWIGNQTLR